MGTSRLGKLLVEDGLLTESDRRTIKRTCGGQGAAFARSILALGLLDEDELAAFLAEKTRWQVGAKDLRKDLQDSARGLVDRPLLERLEVLPLKLVDATLHVAMVDPLDQDTIKQLAFFTGYKIHPVIATLTAIRAGLREVLEEYYPARTHLEAFLTNHADAASRRLKIVEKRPQRRTLDPNKPFSSTPRQAPTVAKADFKKELSLGGAAAPNLAPAARAVAPAAAEPMLGGDPLGDLGDPMGETLAAPRATPVLAGGDGDDDLLAFDPDAEDAPRPPKKAEAVSLDEDLSAFDPEIEAAPKNVADDLGLGGDDDLSAFDPDAEEAPKKAAPKAVVAAGLGDDLGLGGDDDLSAFDPDIEEAPKKAAPKAAVKEESEPASAVDDLGLGGDDDLSAFDPDIEEAPKKAPPKAAAKPAAEPASAADDLGLGGDDDLSAFDPDMEEAPKKAAPKAAAKAVAEPESALDDLGLGGDAELTAADELGLGGDDELTALEDLGFSGGDEVSAGGELALGASDEPGAEAKESSDSLELGDLGDLGDLEAASATPEAPLGEELTEPEVLPELPELGDGIASSDPLLGDMGELGDLGELDSASQAGAVEPQVEDSLALGDDTLLSGDDEAALELTGAEPDVGPVGEAAAPAAGELAAGLDEEFTLPAASELGAAEGDPESAADLSSEADLTEADLTEADLTEADLTEAKSEELAESADAGTTSSSEDDTTFQPPALSVAIPTDDPLDTVLGTPDTAQIIEMHAAAVINRAILGVSFVADLYAGLQRAAPALSVAGLSHGAIFLVEAGKLKGLALWETKGDGTSARRDALSKLVTPGLDAALASAAAGWQELQAVIKPQHMKPFQAWREIKHELRITAVPLAKAKSLVVVASWRQGTKSDGALALAASDLFRRLAQKKL